MKKLTVLFTASLMLFSLGIQAEEMNEREMTKADVAKYLKKYDDYTLISPEDVKEFLKNPPHGFVYNMDSKDPLAFIQQDYLMLNDLDPKIWLAISQHGEDVLKNKGSADAKKYLDKYGIALSISPYDNDDLLNSLHEKVHLPAIKLNESDVRMMLFIQSQIKDDAELVKTLIANRE